MKPNRLGQFEDVKLILDAALTAGGGEFTLPTHGAAVNWRQRAYTFRKLFAERMAGGMSPYDTLTLRRIGAEDCVVKIDKVGTPGVFVPKGGEAVKVEPAGKAEEEDDLLEVAKSIAANLEIGDL